MIGDRIKEIRNNLNMSQKDLSESLEIKQSVLSNYENGINFPQPSTLDKLSNMGINLDWLITGKGEMYKNNNEKLSYSISRKAPVTDNAVYVDLLDSHASAGYGIENFEIVVIDQIPVPRYIIEPFSPEKVKAIPINGDSMTPTIYGNDTVLYVPELIARDGIYIISVMNELLCKRLNFKLNGDIVVISDNERYEKEVFMAENEILRVCGKVIGWIHKHNY